MLNFMRDGGFAMWLMLASAVAAVAVAATRPSERRGRVLATAAVWVLAQGILGMALGIHATVGAIDRVPPADTARILATGLGELANNGVFAAGLAMLLGCGYVLSTREPASPAPTA